jgi:hypothetical protein
MSHIDKSAFYTVLTGSLPPLLFVLIRSSWTLPHSEGKKKSHLFENYQTRETDYEGHRCKQIKRWNHRTRHHHDFELSIKLNCRSLAQNNADVSQQ